MPRRDLIVVIIAGVCGIIVFVIIMGLLKKPLPKPAVPLVRCVTATQTILKDQEITEAVAAVSQTVENTNVGNYFVSTADLIGYVAVEDIPKDSLIKRSSVQKKPEFVAPAAPKKPTSIPIPTGLRVLSLLPSRVEGVLDEVAPGNYMDVMAEVQNADGQPEIKTIAKLALVSAAYPVSDDDPTIRRFSLALKPRQYDDVTAALRVGKIRLMPRPDGATIAATAGQIEIIRGVTRDKNVQSSNTLVSSKEH